MSYLVLLQVIIFLSGAIGCNVLIYNRLYAIQENAMFFDFLGVFMRLKNA